MSDDTNLRNGSNSSNDPTAVDYIERKVRRFSVSALSAILFISTIIQPAVAQSKQKGTGFCDVKFMGSIVDTAFSIFITGALVVGLLTWVVTSFTESLPLPQETKRSIKQYRNTGLASAGRAIIVPALVLALLSATSIGIPDCVSIF